MQREKQQFNVDIDPELVRKIKRLAIELGVSYSQVVSDGMTKFVAAEERRLRRRLAAMSD